MSELDARWVQILARLERQVTGVPRTSFEAPPRSAAGRDRVSATVRTSNGIPWCVVHLDLPRELQIPTEAERAFRLKPNTDSEGSRTPVPTEREQ